MIVECMIFLSSVIPMGIDENKIIGQYLNCNDHVPKSMQEHASLYVEHFDKENIDTAVRIGWCESRGKVDAYRSDNGDTGLMQFVSWTWNWVAERYELPEWDTWVVTRYGKPYTGKTSKTDIGFSFDRVKKQLKTEVTKKTKRHIKRSTKSSIKGSTTRNAKNNHKASIDDWLDGAEL